MCVTCGCSDESSPTVTNLQTGETEAITSPTTNLKTHSQHGSHEHTHVLADGTVITHTHAHPVTLHGATVHSHPSTTVSIQTASQIHAAVHGQTIEVEHKLLAKNDLIAAQNRGWLKERNILALNLVSSPGSGKTTLLTRTITELQSQMAITVIEGDQETANDAQRIKATGCPVVQVNTGTGCHLEASMIDKGLQTLNPPPNSLLLIENVGNLVCPALFDLGEHAKVAILSVTEGEDKPIKYPHMFRACQVMILTKIDLLPYVSFNVNDCLAYARQVNPAIEIFQVSATTGEGMSQWYEWLTQRTASQRIRSHSNEN